MIVAEENIESVIPHRKPFIMIDNLLYATPAKFESDFLVRRDNIFLKNEILQEAALIENIAQTCAAGFGFLQRQPEGKPQIGFIGAISKVHVYNLPKVNSKIKTQVAVTYQLENIFLIKGEALFESDKLLECEMKIVVS